jgi:hypothetical protein
LEPGTVKLGGEIGRRIGVTVDNNLLAINIERDFLQPFIDRKHKGGFIGLGMLIDSLVHMAAHTGDARVLDLKKRTVAAAIATQEPDGYLGINVPETRIWSDLPPCMTPVFKLGFCPPTDQPCVVAEAQP